jgi:uncharacterized membrane protein
MAVFVVVLRALHILGGVFWAGGAIVINGFVMPSVAATRPESGKFMQHLSTASGFTFWMTVASTCALLGGLVLYSPVTGGFNRDIMQSTRGIVLSLGALLGLLAYLEGLFVVGPTVKRMGALAKAATGAGGPPNPENLAKLEAMRVKLARVGVRGAWLLGLTATLMAVARYL